MAKIRLHSGRIRTLTVLSVQLTDMSALNPDHFHVIMFVGARQTRIPYQTVAKLQEMGSNAAYVKISGSGPNALDFHIAFYIGELAGSDKKASFFVVSKDAGFDPLLNHLKTRKIRKLRVRRVSAFSDIALLKSGNAKSALDPLRKVVNDLHARGTAKPRTLNTLRSTIAALFQKKLSDDQLGTLLSNLQANGWVSVDGKNKVTYSLPT